MVLTRRLAAIFPPAALATFLAYRLLQSPSTGIDDADIFLAYARNLAAGRGFVFNAGGERVEGFSSLLWVLLCAAASTIAGTPEALLLGLTLALLLLTIAPCLGSRIVERTTGGPELSRPWAGVLVVLLLSEFRFVAWNTVTLMDTAVWTCVLTSTVLVVLDDRPTPRRLAWRLAGLNVLLVLTRPEGLLWAPLMTLLFLLTRPMSQSRIALRPLIAPPVVAFVATATLLTIGRLWYFGYPLPNTFYAKVPPSLAYRLHEGFGYLWAYIGSGFVVQAAVLALFGSVAHLVRIRGREPQTLILAVSCVAGLMVPVTIGGDHFAGFRFYQSVFPLLVLALLNSVRFVLPQYVAMRQTPSLPRSVRIGAAAGLAAWFVIGTTLDWTGTTDRAGLIADFNIAARGRREGRAIDALFAGTGSLPSVATITAGGLKYGYPGEIVDLMGLNNTRVAHNGGTRAGYRSHAAFEKRTFYELRPLILVPHSQYTGEAAWRRVSFVDEVLKGLLDDPQFRTMYRLAEVKGPTPDGDVSVVAWYDIHFLAALARSTRYRVYFAPSAAARLARSGVMVQ